MKTLIATASSILGFVFLRFWDGWRPRRGSRIRMKNKDETLVFRDKLDNLRAFLQVLKKKRKVNDATYSDYSLLLWKARTINQLDAIAHDLAEICPDLGHSTSSPRS